VKSRGALAAAALALGAALGAASCSFEPFCVAGDSDCLDAGCNDGLKNGDETDVDCGGACAPCATGLLCIADDDCATGRCAQDACCEAPCALWTRAWGGLVDDRATAIAVAHDGSFYVAGRFSGAVDFGLGPLVSRGVDVFLLRLRADGSLIWGKSFGGVLDDAQVELATTAADHVVVALVGASQSVDFGGGPLENGGAQNPYLAELDAEGRHVWSRAFATPGEAGVSAVAIAPDGDILVSGSTYGVDLGGGMLESAGALDAYVGRLSPTGEHRWSKRFGSAWHDLGGRVATDADGNVYLAAYYSRSWSFGGGLLPWANGTGSLAVAKLDPNGGHLWSHGYAAPTGLAGQISTDVTVDHRGTMWVTGWFGDPTDFGTGFITPGVGSTVFLLAYETDGALRFVRTAGEHTGHGMGVVPDGDGGVVLVGSFRGNVDFGEGVKLERGLDNVFLSRFDRDGRALWARNAGGRTTTEPLRVARALDGASFYVVGGFQDRLDAAFGSAVSAGEADTFVLAVAP
jgi:hypothetical protein